MYQKLVVSTFDCFYNDTSTDNHSGFLLEKKFFLGWGVGRERQYASVCLNNRILFLLFFLLLSKILEGQQGFRGGQKSFRVGRPPSSIENQHSFFTEFSLPEFANVCKPGAFAQRCGSVIT